MPTNFPTGVDNFTNPTANDSLNLPSHSTQHTNANDAIEAIEGYLLNGGQGLTLVKKQTIGTAVSSVVVNEAFNTTYDNYQVLIAGGVGSTNSIDISLNVGGTTTSYYANAIYALYSGTTVAAANVNNGNTWQYAGSASTAGIWGCFDILSPFLATNTVFSSRTPQVRTNGSSLFNSGWHGAATSYTSFTLTPVGGTLTGGTIYVYGYSKGQ
jgi:hypothetical protein